MAENKVNISVSVDVEKAKKELEELANRIRELNASGDDNEEIVKALEKQYDTLADNVSKAEAAQDKQNKTTKDSASVAGLASKMVNALGLSNTALGKAVKAVDGAIKTATTAIKAATTGMNAFKKSTDSANTSIGKLKNALKGNWLTLAIGAVVAAGVAVYNWYKNNESLRDSINKLRMDAYAKQVNDIADSYNRVTETMSAEGRMQSEINDKAIEGLEQQISKLSEYQDYIEDLIGDEIDWAKLKEGDLEYYAKLEGNLKEVADRYLEARRQQQDSSVQKTHLENLNIIQRQTEQYELQKQKLSDAASLLEQSMEFEFERYGYSKKYFDLQKQRYDYIKAEIEADIAQNSWNPLVKQAGEARLKLLDQEIALQRELALYAAKTGGFGIISSIKEAEAISKAANVSNIETLYEAFTDLNGAIYRAGEDMGVLFTDLGIEGADTIDDMVRKFESLTNELNNLEEGTDDYIKTEEELIRVSNQMQKISDAQQKSVTSINNILNASIGAMTGLADKSVEFAQSGMFSDVFTNQFKDSIRAMSLVLNDLKYDLGYDYLPSIMDAYGISDEFQKQLIDIRDGLTSLGAEGINIFEEYIKQMQDLLASTEASMQSINLSLTEQWVSNKDMYLLSGVATMEDVYEKENGLIQLRYDQEIDKMDETHKSMLQAGISQLEADAWLAERHIQIENDKYAQMTQLAWSYYNQQAEIAQNSMNSIATIMDAAFEDNKGVQIATTIASTIANAAQTYGSVMATAPGGPTAKAVQASLASAAVIASGIKAVNELNSTNKNTKSFSGGSTSSLSGSRDVSNQYITSRFNNINKDRVETVVVVDDIEYKMKQANRVKVTSKI